MPRLTRRSMFRTMQLATIVLVWTPALHAPFTYDDRIEVVGNRTIRWLDSVGAIASYNTSRPLLILTYALNWRVGGLDPFGYHVVSLLIHALNALLAWRLAGRLLTPGRAALVAAAWALHPMTTEAVTCRPSDSALPPTFMPSTDAIVPMIKAMKGALMRPAKIVLRSMLGRSRSMKASGVMPE